MSRLRWASLSFVAILLVPGCGSDGGSDTTILNTLFRGELSFTARGGGATGNATGTAAGMGGSLSVTSGGNIFIGQNPPPLAPARPTPTGAVTVVASWIDTQIIDTGSAVIDGSVVAGTTGGGATLTVTTGDLFIFGTLTSADNGASETDLRIDVPAGTVWIEGTIRTGRVDGVANGDDAGSLAISALRIIYTGTIDARGEDGLFGGLGGIVLFDTGDALGQTTQMYAGGSIDVSGGGGSGVGAGGGSAGDFQSYIGVAAGGAVHVQGTVFTLNGGSAAGSGSVAGGFGGRLDLQANAGVFFNGVLSTNGGNAFSSDGDAIGGDAGGFFANDQAVSDSGPCALFGTVNASGGSASCGPSAIGLGGFAGFITVVSGSDVNLGTGLYSLRGGDSSGSGGAGGNATILADTGAPGDIYFDALIDCSCGSGAGVQVAGVAGAIEFRTDLGDIQLGGSLIANGGPGSGTVIVDGPSGGGSVYVQTGNGDPFDGGSIILRGTIQANGGSDADSSDDTDGAVGGLIEFVCANPAGSIYLDPGSSIQASGGNAAGPTLAPIGGSGGQVFLSTCGGSIFDGVIGGNVVINGTITARGGAGGGFGGIVLVESDTPFVPSAGGGDGRAGDITLLPLGTVNVSGGQGAIGGDALNDGTTGVSSPIAVTFDADGNDSDDPFENGIIENFGSIVARGGAVDGFGGDVLFDGLDSGGAPGPLPASIDTSGSGGGLPGDFASQ